MNNRLIISTVLIVLWAIFVIYCLLNGAKLLVPSKTIRKVYWIITAISVDFALYLINGLSVWCIGLMLVNSLITALYISIPSGYNTKGIFIRGFFFPFSKIEDMKIEKVLRTNRLNFKCFGCIFYIDADEYKTLKDCEMLFKEEKYK